MTKAWKILLTIFTVLLLSLVILIGFLIRPQENARYTSPDGKYRLSVYDGWKTKWKLMDENGNILGKIGCNIPYDESIFVEWSEHDVCFSKGSCISITGEASCFWDK